MFSKVYIGYSEVAMGKNEDNWLAKYTALRDHVEAHGHLTDRHTQLNHWWKYQKKKRKEGKLTEEQERLLDELMGLRTHEHTGGRRKASHDNDALSLR